MTAAIIDSSVFLAGILGEEFGEVSLKLVGDLGEDETDLHAPWLLSYEMINALRNAVARGRLDIRTAEDSLNNSLLLPIRFHADKALARRAYEIAAQHNLPQAYDAQYLALADRPRCPFWTADRKLHNAVTDRVDSVRWIGEYR